MKLQEWWSNLPSPWRNALQIVWCALLVLVLVLFWSQKNDFIYAGF